MKQIEGYGGYYFITKDSRVWTLPRERSSKHGKFLKASIDAAGYYSVKLTYNKRQDHHRIHRLLAIAYIPNPNKLPQINHKDGVKTNNLLSNLEWCTHRENMLHSVRIGLHKPLKIRYGVDNFAAKLNPTKAREIRQKRKDGMQLKTLASVYGVGLTTVKDIVYNLRWLEK